MRFYVESKFSSDFWTQLVDKEIGWLFAQMYNIPDNPLVVELGSLRGTSSVALACGIKAFRKKGKLYCVDPWDGSYYLPCDCFDEWHENMKRLDLLDIAIPIKEKAVDAVTIFKDKSIDFLFKDSEKHYQTNLDELEAYLPKMKNNGILCGHDWDDKWPEVKKAVGDFCGKHKFTLIDVDCGTLFMILFSDVLHVFCEKSGYDQEELECFLTSSRDFVKIRKAGTEEYIHTVDLR